MASRYEKFWKRWDRLYSAFEEELDRGVVVQLKDINLGVRPKDHLRGWVDIPPEGEPGDYRIVIDERGPYERWIDTLDHELAHILDGIHNEEDLDHHGPSWGIQYSRVYQEVAAW